jgi:hypothetical protein
MKLTVKYAVHAATTNDVPNTTLLLRIILPEDVPRFYRAVESAFALRNSIPLETALLAAVYIFGLWFWNSRFAIETATWYRFLWHVSRIPLTLIPTHPDRSGGLGFLGAISYSFGPVLLGQGAMLAGLIASRVLYHDDSVLSFKLQAGSFVVFFVCVVFAPLIMFTPQMARTRRKGLAEYGLLAQRYVEHFQEKWIVGYGSNSGELLGTGDIQSLADLGNSYTVVNEMRMVPFGLKDMTRLAAATAAPLVPLLLLVWSPEEVIMRVIKVVF